jgi:hypothetical protein
MPQDFNINRTTPATTVQPMPKTNAVGNERRVNIAEKSTVREIAPLTEYNNETGLLDIKADAPWGRRTDEEGVEQSTQSENGQVQQEASTNKDRHAQWKQEQSQKKAEREQKRTEKQVQKQAQAKALLSQGDLLGAANALDMSPADLVTLVTNAALQIKPEDQKALSPEEKKQREEEQFRKERLQFEQEQKDWRYQQIASNYIRDNITPELQNKDKYEFIHQNDINQIQSYTYEYMNKHFQETGETLNAKDVLETIEEQMYQSYVASLEKGRSIKKVAQYFQPKEEQEGQDAEGQQLQSFSAPKRESVSVSAFLEPTLANKTPRPLDSRFPTRQQEQDVDTMIAEAEAEEERIQKSYVPSSAARGTPSNYKTPFAFLSREERLARIRQES